MLVLATNQPEQFDWAINDRIDKMVEFDIPSLEERERMVRHYFDKFVLQPSFDQRRCVALSSNQHDKLCNSTLQPPTYL